jgi:hypothetical protein
MKRGNEIEAAIVEVPESLLSVAQDMEHRLQIRLFFVAQQQLQPDRYHIRYAGALHEAKAKAGRLQ